MKRTMFSRDYISMVPAIKSEQSVIAAVADLPAHWEQRSAKRVPDAGRDQILERSRKIVEAAYDLLEEEGLEGLTVRAVLNRTGLSRRAFYERFEGKDDLVLAVFEQTIRAATLHFSKLISTLAGPIERLELIVTHLVLGRDLAGPCGSFIEQSPRCRAESRALAHGRIAPA